MKDGNDLHESAITNVINVVKYYLCQMWMVFALWPRVRRVVVFVLGSVAFESAALVLFALSIFVFVIGVDPIRLLQTKTNKSYYNMAFYNCVAPASIGTSVILMRITWRA